MNIYLDSIHLPSFFCSGNRGNFIGELRNHAVCSMQILSNYMRYNELTLAGSVIGINLGLLSLSEKTISLVSGRFDAEFFKKPWVGEVSSLLFKALFVGVGIYGINHLMNLQLDEAMLVASVVASIALKILWQKVIAPEISSLWQGSGKIEEEVLSVDPHEAILEDAVDDAQEGDKVVRDSDKSEVKVAEAEQSEKKVLDDELAKNEVKSSRPVTPKPIVPPLNTEQLKKVLSEKDVLDDDVMTPKPQSGRDEVEEFDDIGLHEMAVVPSGGTESMLESAPFFGALEALAKFDKKSK